MQNLIADYLFENRKCSLPNLGLLNVVKNSASYNFGEQIITAPIHNVAFEVKEINDSDFINFVAVNKNISSDSAKNEIDDFTKSISNLQLNEKVEINGIGYFLKNENEEIKFVSEKINEAFIPNVQALKVVHPNATHNMTVGDTETDTATMTEYYSEDESKKFEKWWIAVIVFFVISIATILFGLFGLQKFGIGNMLPIEKIENKNTIVLPK